MSGKNLILSGDCLTKPSSVTCLMVAKKPVLVAAKIIKKNSPMAKAFLKRHTYSSRRKNSTLVLEVAGVVTLMGGSFDINRLSIIKNIAVKLAAA